VEQVKNAMVEHQKTLSKQWINQDDISTEELRIVLQNYRALINRLLET
jgi:hypothetical protein